MNNPKGENGEKDQQAKAKHGKSGRNEKLVVVIFRIGDRNGWIQKKKKGELIKMMRMVSL